MRTIAMICLSVACSTKAADPATENEATRHGDNGSGHAAAVDSGIDGGEGDGQDAGIDDSAGGSDGDGEAATTGADTARDTGRDGWTDGSGMAGDDGPGDGEPPGDVRLMPDFALENHNPSSPMYGTGPVSPRDLIGTTTGWYFTHAT